MRKTQAGATAVASILLLAGCVGSGAPAPTGAATTYQDAATLRDAFVTAGGKCDDWQPIDPGPYDADAGRCSDSIVIAVYHKPDEMEAAISRSQNLVMGTHLLVGENWILNVESPQNYVDALGGRVVS